MNFNCGDANAFQRIEYGNACVSISTGIYHYAVENAVCLLYLIHKATFVVGLIAFYLDAVFIGMSFDHVDKIGISAFDRYTTVRIIMNIPRGWMFGSDIITTFNANIIDPNIANMIIYLSQVRHLLAVDFSLICCR